MFSSALTSRLDPATLAALARRTPEPLYRALALAPVRAAVVTTIFRQMPRRVRAGADLGAAVVRWDVEGSTWFLVLEGSGASTTRREPGERPRATLTLPARELVRVATGAADPMALFQQGRIKVSGDLWFAAQLSSLFEIPAG